LCGAIFDAGDPKPEIPGAPFSARSVPDALDVPSGVCDATPLGADEAAVEQPVVANIDSDSAS
jgi:hypothetical protein